MKEGEGKEEGAEIGWREGFVNQSEKSHCAKEGSKQKKGGNCLNVVDS